MLLARLWLALLFLRGSLSLDTDAPQGEQKAVKQVEKKGQITPPGVKTVRKAMYKGRGSPREPVDKATMQRQLQSQTADRAGMSNSEHQNTDLYLHEEKNMDVEGHDEQRKIRNATRYALKDRKTPKLENEVVPTKTLWQRNMDKIKAEYLKDLDCGKGYKLKSNISNADVIALNKKFTPEKIRLKMKNWGFIFTHPWCLKLPKPAKHIPYNETRSWKDPQLANLMKSYRDNPYIPAEFKKTDKELFEYAETNYYPDEYSKAPEQFLAIVVRRKIKDQFAQPRFFLHEGPADRTKPDLYPNPFFMTQKEAMIFCKTTDPCMALTFEGGFDAFSKKRQWIFFRTTGDVLPQLPPETGLKYTTLTKEPPTMIMKKEFLTKLEGKKPKYDVY